MNNHQFFVSWSECCNYRDRDAYISDMALSTIWGDAENMEVPSERIERLSAIWNVHSMSMRDIRAAANMTQAEYAEAFCIPKRTVENWDTGLSTPPDYVKILIAKRLNLL